ncbi:MAG: AEC family transporter [Clostridia bacterium]|nr:AEC family transporter [Clostridia bacterium]
MLDVFVTSINAIVPIILLILLGYLLKRVNLLNENFIKIGNKFVFRVCLPCMLFINIYDKMQSFADIRWDVVLYSVIVICLIFALGLITAILTTKHKNRRGVILQCSFRSNFAIIGLTLVERLGGDLGLAGIISAFSIPVFNILAVVALSIFSEEGGGQKHGLKNIVLNILKNPLIIGVVVGLFVVGIREIERACCGGEVVFSLKTHLKFLYIGLSDVKVIASPLALIILGGQFEFTAVKGMTKEIIVGTAWRILLAPLIGIGLAVILSNNTDWLNFGSNVYPTLIALFGTPVAVSSAIMAGEMKNDEQLATQLVVWTSVCSIATIFVTVFIMMSYGLLMV